MKVKLLKELRKKAKRKYIVECNYPKYAVIRKYLDDEEICCSDMTLESALYNLKKERRDYILREVKYLRSKKINKMLKKI